MARPRRHDLDAAAVDRARKLVDEHVINFAAAVTSREHAQAMRSAMRQFAAWCQERGVRHLPAEPETVAGYISWRARDGLAVGSIAVH